MHILAALGLGALGEQMTQQLFALVQAIWKTMQASQKNLAGIERQLAVANTIKLWEIAPKDYTRPDATNLERRNGYATDYATLLTSIKALP